MSDFAGLDVRLEGRRVGVITRLSDDKNLFAFDQSYIDDPERPVLSLSFKDAFGGLITELQIAQTRLPPFFSNLLPEGPMRDYLARRAEVNPEREFFLLRALGRDLPGAVEIVPQDGTGDILPDDAREAHTLRRNRPLRFSLAGVQLKFSAVRNARGGLTVPADGTGGSWIVKLPSATHVGVPENEYAMMELARRSGIDVPQTRLLPIEEVAGLPAGIDGIGPNAFVIARFDRGPQGERIHVEDFAQVFGVYPERKYARASYRNIAEVIWTEIGETGIAEFIRRLTFNALIGNGDMHLKNWSLIYPDGRHAALAPAYDFVSTLTYVPDDRMALSFMKHKDFAALDVALFREFAGRARLPQKLVFDVMQDTVARFRSAWLDSADLPVPPAVRTAIAALLETLPIWQYGR